jgi:chromate transporter
MGHLREVAGVFLKIGTLGFGGPAAHVAMMRDEIVVRREWVDEQEFVDALGATSVLPGPGSTQMAIYLARRRAGWPGLVVGGTCFILPAMCIVLVLAWAYVDYGTTDVGRGLLYGITPVVIGIVADAVLGLGRIAITRVHLALLASLAVVGFALDVNVLVLLLGAGAVELVARTASPRFPRGPSLLLPVVAGVALWDVFKEFLKLGAVTFGSGYVLVAFLEGDLVDRLHWLTPHQLVDAVSVGQITPGPVFTTATFVGYLVAGLWGGVVATIGIFLPSFVLVAAFGWLIPRLRRTHWTAAVLDGINAAVIGLMVAVTAELGSTAVVDLLTGMLAVGAFLVMVVRKPNFAWLILVGAAVGLLHTLV